MKTVGEILKEARLRKNLSLKKVEQKTKIKREFIELIEKGDWKNLPDFPVVLGFAKNLASFLEIDSKLIASLLKRDYPPQKVNINPKPDVGGKFVWTPKYTFLIGILLIVVMIFGYLGFQFFKFRSPPKLEVFSPINNLQVENREIEVRGKTDPDAVVKVNNQTALVDENGIFSAMIEVSENTSEVKISAVTRSGKETLVVRKINLKLE